MTLHWGYCVPCFSAPCTRDAQCLSNYCLFGYCAQQKCNQDLANFESKCSFKLLLDNLDNPCTVEVNCDPSGNCMYQRFPPQDCPADDLMENNQNCHRDSDCKRGHCNTRHKLCYPIFHGGYCGDSTEEDDLCIGILTCIDQTCQSGISLGKIF